jgi:hypothetical protein
MDMIQPDFLMQVLDWDAGGSKFHTGSCPALKPWFVQPAHFRPLNRRCGMTFSIIIETKLMERNKDNPRGKNIPENDPSKAMDSKKEVEESNDNKIDQDFPGYPHYPAREDIMDQRTGARKSDMDVENLPSGRNATGVSQRFVTGQGRTKDENRDRPAKDADDLQINMGNDADVNDDDLAVLNSTDAEIGTPQNVSNEDLNTDLDVPGSELDDANESVGEEDEENNYYSLGGDRHESQEEDPYSGPDRES